MVEICESNGQSTLSEDMPIDERKPITGDSLEEPSELL
jgi:hypothetical protein